MHRTFRANALNILASSVGYIGLRLINEDSLVRTDVMTHSWKVKLKGLSFSRVVVFVIILPSQVATFRFGINTTSSYFRACLELSRVE